ncbi:hypothetical protein ACFSNO_09995 [Streptomyces cirratus]
MTGSHPADQDPADRNPAENPVGRFGALAPAETAFTLELEAALADGPLEDEGWRIRKDGSRFWVNVVITPLFDGGLDPARLRHGHPGLDRAPRRRAGAHRTPPSSASTPHFPQGAVMTTTPCCARR